MVSHENKLDFKQLHFAMRERGNTRRQRVREREGREELRREREKG